MTCNQASEALSGLGPVTSLGWNGTDWLVGGYGSLAIYNGHKFIDLTGTLAAAIGREFHAVNAISWDKLDNMWLLAGGYPKADVHLGNAWAASLSSSGQAKNLTPLISTYLGPSSSSSILTATFKNGLWAVGGYKTKGKQITPILLVISLPTNTITDLSQTMDDTTYVIWMQFNPASQRLVTQVRPKCELSNEPPAPNLCAAIEKLSSTHANNITSFPSIPCSIATVSRPLGRKISSLVDGNDS